MTTEGQIMDVDVHTRPRLSAGKPRQLFQGNYSEVAIRNYDLTPDGSQFLMTQYSDSQPPPPPIIIVRNWFQDLKARAN